MRKFFTFVLQAFRLLINKLRYKGRHVSIDVLDTNDDGHTDTIKVIIQKEENYEDNTRNSKEDW